MTRALAGLVALASCLPGFVYPTPVRAEPAAPADTAIVEIEGLSVMGRRPGTTRGGSSLVRATIDSLPLPAAATMREVLEELPTVHVRTNSRGEAEISVRGSASRQVSVTYDGLPLTLSWDGRTDVSVIPVGAMRQVSLVPGLATLLSGPNVLGGVIDFRSTLAGGGREHPSMEAAAGVDESGGFGTTASITVPRFVPTGRMTLRAGGGHRDTPGATLASGVEQPIVTDDLRTNTDVTSSDLFASLRYDHAPGGWLSLSSSASREERGIAAELDVDAPRYWRYPLVERSLTVLSMSSGARVAPWGGAASLQASFGLDMGRTEIDAFDSIDYDTLAAEEDGDQNTLSMRVAANQTLGGEADLRLAVTSGQMTYDETLTPGSTNRYRQRLWSVAGETAVRRPMAGDGALEELDFALGLAYDRSTNPLTGDKPGMGPLDEFGGRLGISALFADGSLVAHASVNRRARFPSPRELYSGALNRFTPNPELRPEVLLATEAGVTRRGARASLQVVGFLQQLDDAVVRIRESGKFKRVNEEGQRSIGAEVVGSHRFGRHSLSANLTAQSVESLDPDAALEHPENQPALTAGLGADLDLGRGLRFAASVRYTGEQYSLDPDTGVLATLSPGAQVDLDLRRDWRIGAASGWASTLGTRIAVDNLTDEAIYDAYGLPGPGRLIRFELRLQ